jgi:hypothetical protein
MESKRRLSSRWTFVYRFLLPALMIVLFGLTSLAMFINPAGWKTDIDVRILRLLFLGCALGSAIWLRAVSRLYKDVWLGSSSLTIAGRSGRIEVPLADVERVTGTRFINPPTVSVYFRRPTPFGGKIVFVAPGRWFGGFGLPAAAKELQRLTQPPRRS